MNSKPPKRSFSLSSNRAASSRWSPCSDKSWPCTWFHGFKKWWYFEITWLSLQIDRVKNSNKNPVVEKAILELEEELLKQEPTPGQVSQLGLVIAVARLNSCIHYSGLSARELWTQRSQFTHEQLPISDRENLLRQHTLRTLNHTSSEKSKHKSGNTANSYNVDVGDLVNLYSDRDKSRARNRYLVVSIDGEWCFIKKFSGNQLRSSSYKVKREEYYLVPNGYSSSSHSQMKTDFSTDDEDTTFSIPIHPHLLLLIYLMSLLIQ